MSTESFKTTPVNVAPQARTDHGTSGLRTTPAVPETGDDRLLNQVSALRDGATFLQKDVQRLHDDVRGRELDERTTAAALRDPRDLLRELSHRHGLSWATIARLSSVSPTAVRKWRRGEAIGSVSRRNLARAVTFLEMLGEHSSPIADVGTWLEMPLSDQTTLAPVDLYAGGRVELLFDHVAGHLTAHGMLDRYEPTWRTSHAPDERFTVEPAPDGNLSIIENEQ